MKITEVRIKLLQSTRDKLRAFASLTLDDCLVVRDIKVIEGGRGLFVAMPSRKLCDRCPACGGKNHLRARFCNDCGKRLRADRGMHDERGRMRLYADISHPIHQKARAFVEGRVIEAFQQELERSKQEGYVAHSFEDLDYESYENGHRQQHPVE
jgi:stage V sporulation protein G